VPEAWRFFKKVWKFWKINLTGSALIALLFLFEIFVRSVAWWAYAGIAAATLIMSCFLAWRDEYRSRLALESSRGEEWRTYFSSAPINVRRLAVRLIPSGRSTDRHSPRDHKEVSRFVFHRMLGNGRDMRSGGSKV
jgi:hypothetical protein